MKQSNNYRYVAYDAANGEYEEFKTLKEAEDWLTEGDGEGISEESCCGQNYIAEIQYRSVVTVTDKKEDYLISGEEWLYGSDFEWIGKQSYEKIDWDEEEAK